MPHTKSEEAKNEQQARFKQAAREIEADVSDAALDKVMSKLDLKKKPEPEKLAEK